MPEALRFYWAAWNEESLDRIPAHLRLAVTEDVAWNDPRDSLVGIRELEAAIRRLRTNKPNYFFILASEIDHHHDRLRYRWDMISRGRTLMEGVDIVAMEPATGLISRVDGFFGHPTPIKPAGSGIPAELRGTVASHPRAPI